jgi:hypothetical protein
LLLLRRRRKRSSGTWGRIRISDPKHDGSSASPPRGLAWRRGGPKGVAGGLLVSGGSRRRGEVEREERKKETIVEKETETNLVPFASFFSSLSSNSYLSPRRKLTSALAGVSPGRREHSKRKPGREREKENERKR